MRRANIITIEELESRLLYYDQTFAETQAGSQDNGVFGILQESAEGAKNMLKSLIGL